MTAIRRPPVIAAALLCAATLAIFWPGIVEYDTLRQYEQAVAGRFDDWHPPIMARLWQALLPLGHGPAPLFALQVAGYWAGLALIADALAATARPRTAWAVVAIGLLPPLLGWQVAVLKDAQMVGAALAATGLVARYRLRDQPVPRAAALAAAVLFAYALLVRANAPFALAPLIATLLPLRRMRGLVAATVAILAATLILASPVNHALLGATRSDVALTPPRYDLAGIAVRVPGASMAGLPADVAATLRRDHCVTPYFWDPLGDTPGCTAAIAPWASSGAATLYARLGAAALRHPLAYARQRAAHLNMTWRWLVPAWLPGAAPPTGSEPNEYFSPRMNPVASAWQGAAGWATETPLGWPFAWNVAALLLLAVAIRHPPAPTRRLALGLLASALLLEASFVAISIASDLRYHLWPIVATALAAVLLLDRRPSRRLVTVAVSTALLLGAPALVARVTLAAPPQEYDDLLRWTPPLALLPG